MKFGTAIREWRKALHFTQAEFADAIGVSRLTVIKWEKRDKIPNNSAQYERLVAKIIEKKWLDSNESLRISIISA